MGKTSRKNTSWFIDKAREIHGDKYDYSKVDYKNGRGEVVIICPIHGEFKQIAKSHLRGRGCRECGRLGSTKLKSNTQDFISKAQKVHGSKYDYSKVDYKARDKEVCIICPIHGEFMQFPYMHLYGHDCPYCKNVKISKVRISNEHSIVAGAKNDLLVGEYNKKSYKHWMAMLGRCYGYGKNTKAYCDCTVCDEWLLFSNFNRWFEQNYIEGNALDKDILSSGNKVYSPQTCCFVPCEVNSIFTTYSRQSNELPTGVHYSKNKKRFFSIIDIDKKQIRLGTFDTIEEASSAYKREREKHIRCVAEKYKDRLKEDVYYFLCNYKM